MAMSFINDEKLGHEVRTDKSFGNYLSLDGYVTLHENLVVSLCAPILSKRNLASLASTKKD